MPVWNNVIKDGHKPGKPGILKKSSVPGKLRELSGNSLQFQVKIVTNKIMSPDAGSEVQKCSKMPG